MIKFFTTNDCLGCRHAKKFLEDNKIEFIEKNFTKERLSEQELKDILSLTNNGFEDIISIRSKEFAKFDQKDLEDMKFNDIIELIIKHPTILRRPIIIQFNTSNIPYRLLVGYNSSDIEIFSRSNNEKENIYRSAKCIFKHHCENGTSCTNKNCKCEHPEA